MEDSLAFLVVEDDEPVRKVLVRWTKEHGHVDAVGSVAAARAALRARRYDAAIIDITLPDGSGLDLLELAHERSPGICLLVLTGSVEHEVISRTMEARARYLLKPGDGKHITALAKEAKDRRTAQERRTQVTLGRWQREFHLSKIEVELLALGARGVPREHFARRRGVRPDTVRKQIQSLLHKTGDDTFDGAVKSLLREAVAEPT